LGTLALANSGNDYGDTTVNTGTLRIDNAGALTGNGGVTIGPGPSPVPAQPGGRSDLWQLLTPEQREQLWRSLTPEQRADVWRGLQPQERREMRERIGPGEGQGPASSWAARRRFGAGGAAPGQTMSAAGRRQMREQVREAHRLRRERMEAERERRKQ
jgi:hypothetical protein